jgi:SAM-dependent methyltransferase
VSTPVSGRLTDVDFWDRQYDSTADVPQAEGTGPRSRSRVRRAVRKILSPKLIALMQDYRLYLLWDVIYPRFLRHRSGARVLEVGSAPGDHLVQLHAAFGLEPYGVEYTAHGADLNRQVFQRNGLDPAHVLHDDFFNPAFQDRYRGSFDVVVSRGFIEHFEDLAPVIDAHVNVLAPGGTLVVTVPNLRGINYWLTWFFQRDFLKVHNLSIMQRSTFARLFERDDLASLYCDYFGAFNVGLSYPKPNSVKEKILTGLRQAQPLLNALYRLAFKPGQAEHRWLSSYLIFVGRKPGSPHP